MQLYAFPLKTARTLPGWLLRIHRSACKRVDRAKFAVISISRPRTIICSFFRSSPRTLDGPFSAISKPIFPSACAFVYFFQHFCEICKIQTIFRCIPHGFGLPLGAPSAKRRSASVCTSYFFHPFFQAITKCP